MLIYPLSNEQLSAHFTLSDLTKTDQNANNNPDETGFNNLAKLADILEDIYLFIGPFRVVSAYRSPLVNALVGGSETSLHLTGEAADIYPLETNINTFFSKLYNSSLKDKLGEIILKPSQGTLHISLPTFSKKGYAMILDSGKYRAMTLDEIRKYAGEAISTVGAVISQNPSVKIATAALALSGALAFAIYQTRKTSYGR